MEGHDSKGSSYLDRQRQLNQQLGEIEKSLNKHKNHKSSYVPKLEELSRKPNNRNKIKGFRGRQSLFKRPSGPAPRTNIRVIPDYRKNPTKWTYYSLEDVPDTSNESNKEAAFAFLNELKERKEREKQKQIKNRLKSRKDAMEVDNIEDNSMDAEDKYDDNGVSVSFRKPQKNDKSSKRESKSEFKGSKLVMPEYEIGVKKVQKTKKNNKNSRLEKIDKNKEIKLGHLQEYDEEDEE